MFPKNNMYKIYITLLFSIITTYAVGQFEKEFESFVKREIPYLSRKIYTNEPLDYHECQQLANIVIKKKVDSTKNFKLEREDFQQLADWIVTLFPKEDSKIFFVRSVFGTSAKGKLYHVYNNYRTFLAKKGLIERRSKTNLKSNAVVVLAENTTDPAESAALDTEINILQTEIDNWELIESVWQSTFIKRQEILKLSSSANEYIEKFPVLKQENAYKLVPSPDGQFHVIPRTSFSCQNRGAGYYADIETGCQIYHMCDGLGRQFSYACPNTTLFQQRMLICDHWYMVNCSRAEKNYDANLLIGQKDKPFVPEGELDIRTPRPDLLSQPYVSTFNAEEFKRNYKNNRYPAVQNTIVGLNYGKTASASTPASSSTFVDKSNPISDKVNNQPKFESSTARGANDQQYTMPGKWSINYLRTLAGVTTTTPLPLVIRTGTGKIDISPTNRPIFNQPKFNDRRNVKDEGNHGVVVENRRMDDSNFVDFSSNGQQGQTTRPTLSPTSYRTTARPTPTTTTTRKPITPVIRNQGSETLPQQAALIGRPVTKVVEEPFAFLQPPFNHPSYPSNSVGADPTRPTTTSTSTTTTTRAPPTTTTTRAPPTTTTRAPPTTTRATQPPPPTTTNRLPSTTTRIPANHKPNQQPSRNIKIPSMFYEPPHKFPIYTVKHTPEDKSTDSPLRISLSTQKVQQPQTQPTPSAFKPRPTITSTTPTPPPPNTEKINNSAVRPTEINKGLGFRKPGENIDGRILSRPPTIQITSNALDNAHAPTSNRHTPPSRDILPPPLAARPTVSPTAAAAGSSTSVLVPANDLLPPLENVITYDDSTTQGPLIYYEWKWAVPALELEPPKFDDTSSTQQKTNVRVTGNPFTPSQSTEVPPGLRGPTARSISHGTTNQFSTGSTERPQSTTDGNDYLKLRKQFSIPDYEFPLEKGLPGQFTENEAVDSFQERIQKKRDFI